MKPLFVPLRAGPFHQFRSGTKPLMEELRLYGPRWHEGTCHPGRAVTLSLGYGKKQRLKGSIEAFRRASIDDLFPEQQQAVIEHYGGRPTSDIACIKIKPDWPLP